MKQTLYILTGLPYSGKTTLTKELVKQLGCKSVSMDEIMDEQKLNPDVMSQEEWNSVYSKGYDQLKRFLQEGHSVVLDLGNLKREERKVAKDIANSLSVESKLIYLQVPLDEIRARWHHNADAIERGQLSDVGLKRAIGMFEEPRMDEDFIRYDGSDSLEWINKNIH